MFSLLLLSQRHYLVLSTYNSFHHHPRDVKCPDQPINHSHCPALDTIWLLHLLHWHILITTQSTAAHWSCLLLTQDRIASLNGRTVQLVIRQDRPGFIRLIGISVLQSAASAVLAPSLRHVANVLALTWRRRLTAAAHSRYFRGNTFYSTSQLAGPLFKSPYLPTLMLLCCQKRKVIPCVLLWLILLSTSTAVSFPAPQLQSFVLAAALHSCRSVAVWIHILY